MIYVVIGLAAVVLVAVVVAVRSTRRPPDGVAMFQRQIDALSPEARRRVVDRVQQFEDPGDPAGPGGPGGPGEGVVDGP